MNQVLIVAINLVFRNCIECLGFGSGPFEKNCSVACSKIIYHVMVDEFTISSKQCQQKDSQGCWIKFKLDQLVGEDNFKAEIVKERGKLLMKYRKFKQFNCIVVNALFCKSVIWKH